MKEAIHKLAGVRDNQVAIAGLSMLDPVTFEPDGSGAWIALGPSGQPIGKLTSRNEAARALSDGQSLLHATVNSISDTEGILSPRVRIATGAANECFELPPAASASRSYPVPLVGEQHYQAAIAKCRAGQMVMICTEEDNPHDPQALVAVDIVAGVLGYIPRDSFVQSAVHDQGKGIFAMIRAVEPGARGFLQVVLDVSLKDAADEAFRVYSFGGIRKAAEATAAEVSRARLPERATPPEAATPVTGGGNVGLFAFLAIVIVVVGIAGRHLA